MITRISSVMNQLIWFLSGAPLYPAALSVSSTFFWSQPSTRVVPIVATTDLPGSAGIVLNDSPCLVRKSLVRSQSENLLHGPTNRWNSQSLAATVIGVFAENSSSAG